MNNDIDATGVIMPDESDQVGDDDFGPLLDPGCEVAAPEVYPRLWNMSAGHMVRGVVRADAPSQPEYVAVPMRPGLWDEANTRVSVAVTK